MTEKQDDPVDRIKGILTLIYNAWNWDLFAFARACDRDPEDPQTKEVFLRFQTAANNLRRIDISTMAILTAHHKGELS